MHSYATRSGDVAQVVLVRWPEERDGLASARRDARPRLILVAPDATPPPIQDPLEDWVRLPASEADVRARVQTLEARARKTLVPRVSDGVLTYGDEWVGLSPVEESLAQALCGDFGAVVSREALMTAAWVDDPPSRNALDVHVLRLRRRLEPLGLEIKTVRSRGYLLQPASD